MTTRDREYWQEKLTDEARAARLAVGYGGNEKS